MNTKPRIKHTIPTIYTRADAEEAVRVIRELTIAKSRRMLDQEEALKMVQEAHRQALTDLDAELNSKTELLSNWAIQHPEEFGKLRSIEMTHGTIGWRKGMPQLKKLVKQRWDQMVETVEKVLGPVYIRTKREVDKERIIQDFNDPGPYASEVLENARLKIVQEESFYVSPRMDEPENRQSVAS